VAELQVLCTPEPIREAARLLVQRLGEIVEQNGLVRLAIPGGSALEVFAAARRALDPAHWKRLRLTWVDERRVSFDHPDSNRGDAYRRHVLDPTDPPGVELPLFRDGELGEEACQRVEEGLEVDFRGGLDLLLLGMGEDGHIASLFPGGHWLPAPARVQAVEDSPKPPPQRISLSQSFLAATPEALLVVTGEGKRKALGRLLQGDPLLPASALPCLTVVTDLDDLPG